ncbi:hypothetical protein V498_05324 [Pseudogymnoascus sp. VKM F-4517 (FW-2822)]|nr:hypothetical protein V498_05324 [Pseudogymnoascus sp. VKM F-4517 (FW-2822)]
MAMVKRGRKARTADKANRATADLRVSFLMGCEPLGLVLRRRADLKLELKRRKLGPEQPISLAPSKARKIGQQTSNKEGEQRARGGLRALTCQHVVVMSYPKSLGAAVVAPCHRGILTTDAAVTATLLAAFRGGWVRVP